MQINSTVNSTISESLLKDRLLKDRLKHVLDEINNVMAVDEKTLVWLLIAYTTLIITGTVGNCLVCFIIAKKPRMRNPRYAYIVNLAVSDLLLCLFTMPFTLLQITLKYWPLGELNRLLLY